MYDVLRAICRGTYESATTPRGFCRSKTYSKVSGNANRHCALLDACINRLRASDIRLGADHAAQRLRGLRRNGDKNGNVFFSSGIFTGAAEVQELLAVYGSIPPNPVILNWSDGVGLIAPGGLALDQYYDLFVADFSADLVEIYSNSGGGPSSNFNFFSQFAGAEAPTLQVCFGLLTFARQRRNLSASSFVRFWPA
jgi:hypothetical protein